MIFYDEIIWAYMKCLGQNMIFGLMMNLYGYKITTNCYINMADCFAINDEGIYPLTQRKHDCLLSQACLKNTLLIKMKQNKLFTYTIGRVLIIG